MYAGDWQVAEVSNLLTVQSPGLDPLLHPRVLGLWVSAGCCARKAPGYSPSCCSLHASFVPKAGVSLGWLPLHLSWQHWRVPVATFPAGSLSPAWFEFLFSALSSSSQGRRLAHALQLSLL